MKSVGVNCDEVQETLHVPLSTSGSASKIPRPSPNVQRKFVRQETFTVTSGAAEPHKNVEPPPSVASILSKLKDSSPVPESPKSTHHVNISSIFATSRDVSPLKSPLPFANSSAFFDVRRTPERERTPVSECPVEKVLQ